MSDDQIHTLREDIRDLVTKVESLSTRVTRLATVAEMSNNHEEVNGLDTRVRTLEGLEQRRLGANGVVGIVTGSIGTLIMSVFVYWLSKH